MRAFCLSQPQGLLNPCLPFLQQTESKAVLETCFIFPAETGKEQDSWEKQIL